MYDLVLKQAKLIDGHLVDIGIVAGKIADIGSITDRALKVLDLNGQHFVSAGWIDSHTHTFALSPIYHDEPDLAGITAGVTTVVDAGSVGADAIDHFYQITRQVKTNIYAFLNISKIGVIRQNELADMNDIDESLLDAAIARYPDFIIGLKARMSKSVVGENGINPLIRAKAMQQKSGLPLMVHIGNNPPNLDDVADLLTKGDIITHCFNGKSNRILTQASVIRDSIERALSRGVVLDVGHGGESFSFAVAERVKELGVYPMTISSDIYSKNRLNGPVFSLANVMTKFLCINYTYQQILDCVTEHAAEMLGIKNKGQIKVGFDADFTIFDIQQENVLLTDAEGTTKESSERFVPLAAIVAGDVILTKEGVENGLSL